MSPENYDYIVIGSGAGGGPLAANLARFGFKVLLMEAGGDPGADNDMGRLMYQVPIFHGASAEYEPIAWNYYVRHYTDEAQQAKDSKKVRVEGKDMVWYPRAGTLGGCTAHHAMITVVPQDSDWNYLAQITGDDSWRAENMRPYFTRLEKCTYVPPPDSLQGIADGIISSIVDLFKGEEDWADWSHGHGFKGWLTTTVADPRLVLKDPQLIALILSGIKDVLIQDIGDPLTKLLTRLDPNDSRNAEASPEGLAFTPLAVDKGKRCGPREYVLRVQQQYPENLTIKKHALASRILFEGTRAVGVEYIDRAHIYGADSQAQRIDDPASLPLGQFLARREVIVAAGAFNSPQLLKLSGVGPRAELEQFGIEVVADLPGVGENLQDRYEVGVISDFARSFDLLAGGTFSPPEAGQEPDAFLKEWLQDGTGVYATNGALIGIIKRSSKDLADPDLYIFGLPSYFKGYQPGYSKHLERYRDKFTWAILKARTNNTGRVQLASRNPYDQPWINFQYFGDGQRQNDPDLEAVLSGVKFVRGLNQRLALIGLIKQEEVPGPQYQSDDELREFIRNEAWGHHASCTNKIGADDDPMAVLDSRFRVRKTQGLRVVDASVFPRIPGYFIVTAIYMISEKAADVIMEDAQR